MSQIIFRTKGLQKLMAELRSAKGYRPCLEELYNPDYYPGGQVLDQNGEVILPGDYSRPPCADKMDKARIEPAFWLVGDRGVYLMPNSEWTLPPGERRDVAYAQGCNPETDEDFYENKQNLFGGDDGSIKIHVHWIETVLEENLSSFAIELESGSMHLLT